MKEKNIYFVDFYICEIKTKTYKKGKVGFKNTEAQCAIKEEEYNEKNEKIFIDLDGAIKEYSQEEYSKKYIISLEEENINQIIEKLKELNQIN